MRKLHIRLFVVVTVLLLATPSFASESFQVKFGDGTLSLPYLNKYTALASDRLLFRWYYQLFLEDGEKVLEGYCDNDSLKRMVDGEKRMPVEYILITSFEGYEEGVDVDDFIDLKRTIGGYLQGKRYTAVGKTVETNERLSISCMYEFYRSKDGGRSQPAQFARASHYLLVGDRVLGLHYIKLHENPDDLRLARRSSSYMLEFIREANTDLFSSSIQ